MSYSAPSEARPTGLPYAGTWTMRGPTRLFGCPQCARVHEIGVRCSCGREHRYETDGSAHVDCCTFSDVVSFFTP